MQRLRALSFLFLLVPFFTSGRNPEIGQGVIQGVVLDDIGNPLPGAKVHAETLGTFPTGGSPFGIVFDGANFWTANGSGSTGSGSTSKL